jgi:hypothetical protein
MNKNKDIDIGRTIPLDQVVFNRITVLASSSTPQRTQQYASVVSSLPPCSTSERNLVLKAILLFLITFLIFCSNTVYADPYTQIPGTKAKGMGGAFVAVANDGSAIYHNPAGLTSLAMVNELITTFEVGTGVTFDIAEGKCAGNYNGRNECAWDYFKVNDVQYFLSAAYLWDKYAVSFALYNLYNVVYPVNVIVKKMKYNSGVYDKSDTDKILYVGQDINILQFGFAMKPLKFLSIGATGAGIFSNFKSMTDGFSVNEFMIGVLGSLGVLAEVVNVKPIKINLGSAYRTQGVMNFPIKTVYLGSFLTFPSSYYDVQSVSINPDNIWKVPSELSGGAAIILSLDSISVTLSGDYRYTDYSKMYVENDLATADTFRIKPAQSLSFGTELGILSFIFVRGGYFSSQDSIRLFDSDGYSAGLGYRLGDDDFSQFIEISFEHRNYYLNLSGTRVLDRGANLFAASIYWVL